MLLSGSFLGVRKKVGIELFFLYFDGPRRVACLREREFISGSSSRDV